MHVGLVMALAVGFERRIPQFAFRLNPFAQVRHLRNLDAPRHGLLPVEEQVKGLCERRETVHAAPLRVQIDKFRGGAGVF